MTTRQLIERKLIDAKKRMRSQAMSWRLSRQPGSMLDSEHCLWSVMCQRDTVRMYQDILKYLPPEDPKPLKLTYIVKTGLHWGRGKLLEEAAISCYKAGAARMDKCYALLILGDDDAKVEKTGMTVYDKSLITEHYRDGLILIIPARLEMCLGALLPYSP